MYILYINIQTWNHFKPILMRSSQSKTMIIETGSFYNFNWILARKEGYDSYVKTLKTSTCLKNKKII